MQPGSFCFRIPREVRGCAAGILPYLVEGERVLSALILSPPGGGKTTLLREIARCLGEEREVGLADERSELAACREGKPTLDVGEGTDVMDGLPKAEAIERMVRAMSPEVLVTDEIGAQEDCAALWNAARCGVALIASAHAGSVREAREKVGLGDLIRKGAFLRLAVLSDVCGPGTLERVEDEKGNCLYEREKGHEKRRYGADVFDLHFLGPAGGAEDPLPRAHSGRRYSRALESSKAALAFLGGMCAPPRRKREPVLPGGFLKGMRQSYSPALRPRRPGKRQRKRSRGFQKAGFLRPKSFFAPLAGKAPRNRRARSQRWNRRFCASSTRRRSSCANRGGCAWRWVRSRERRP